MKIKIMEISKITFYLCQCSQHQQYIYVIKIYLNYQMATAVNFNILLLIAWVQRQILETQSSLPKTMLNIVILVLYRSVVLC